MSVFAAKDFDDHEQVCFLSDPASGLRAIVAIHSTAPFGIAGGGCRMWPYASDDEALADVLRLSRAMSYKLALCDMPAGGAKMVVIGDPKRDKSEPLLRAIGRSVERLGGKYIVAEDVGTTEADMRIIAKETRYVVGQHTDTGPATAHGSFVALRTAAERAFGTRDLRGRRVAIHGVGNVGRRLATYLKKEGAELVVSDIDERAVERVCKELGAKAVKGPAIFEQSVDIFAPCALGAILDDATIGRLQCKLVAGSANNQLAEERHADALMERGILYVPDFIANAGGVIGAAQEGGRLGGGAGEEEGAVYDEAVAFRETERIGPLVERAFDRAERDRVSTHAAAVKMAKEAIAERRGERPSLDSRRSEP